MHSMLAHANGVLIKGSGRFFQVAVAFALLTTMGCRPQGGAIEPGRAVQQASEQVEAVQPVSVTTCLAANGKALHPVVVSPMASLAVRASAAELAEMLTRISAAPFEVIEGDGSSGIVVGVYSNFTACIESPDFAPDVPTRRDEHILRSHADGLWLIGATDSGVEQAVWGLLDRLGYRLFFLTDTWEVVPKISDLRVTLDVFDAPDYISRQAPRGAPWSNYPLWSRWKKRNRVNSGFVPDTGHAYDGIIRANEKAFADHPEYRALLEGKREGSKFCISNPGLRRLVIDYAVGRMTNNPSLGSISMDPSDGGGWCQCAPCTEMGSVSDRVLILANEVVEAINNVGLGPRYVGIYAYNMHSPPPSVTAHSNIVVSVATAFITGGFTIDQLIDGWRASGATLGIRDYHDVFPWSHDTPRSSRGGDLKYLQRTIPRFYEQGARYMNSENGDSWGANGLGFWVTPRLLWRVKEAENLNELVDDFVDKAFGPAREPMLAFYTLLNLDRDVYTGEHVVAMMFRHLAEARRLASSRPDVMARLDDLVLYTRYFELYRTYRGASGEARQAAFESIWRLAYRMRDRLMLFTAVICGKEQYRDSTVSAPEGIAWDKPQVEHPWKDNRPFSEKEIDAMVSAGVAANQPVILDFKPVQFSDTLVPATALTIPPDLPVTGIPLSGRGVRTFLTWMEKPGEIALEITGGLIPHYRNRGNVRVKLFAAEEATLEAVAQDESVPPDGKTYPVTLKTPYAGPHTLWISDGDDSTRFTFPAHLPLTVYSGATEPARLGGRWSLYFYVPKGTPVVGGFTADRTGRMCDSTRKIVFDFTTMEHDGYFNVPVGEGQDGTFWRMENCSGERPLMTVPSYYADHPTRLLLPREVVETDSRTKR